MGQSCQFQDQKELKGACVMVTKGFMPLSSTFWPYRMNSLDVFMDLFVSTKDMNKQYTKHSNLTILRKKKH